MDMEVELLHESFSEQCPKVITDHIQDMTSGKAPYSPATLSFVYDRLIGRNIPIGSNSGNVFGGQGVINSTHLSPFASPFTPNAKSSATSVICGVYGTTPASSSASKPPVLAPTPAPSRTYATMERLKCVRCRRSKQVGQLYDGLHCPGCPINGKNGMGVQGRPFMVCSGCKFLRRTRVDKCRKCKATFV